MRTVTLALMEAFLRSGDRSFFDVVIVTLTRPPLGTVNVVPPAPTLPVSSLIVLRAPAGVARKASVSRPLRSRRRVLASPANVALGTLRVGGGVVPDDVPPVAPGVSGGAAAPSSVPPPRDVGSLAATNVR